MPTSNVLGESEHQQYVREHEADLAQMVDQLRRLQRAANLLNYRQFCEALDWPHDSYSKNKFLEFQKLGRLHVFDSHTLAATVAFYERQ